jgi:hypothetical protein
MKAMDAAVQHIESLIQDAKTAKPRMDAKKDTPKQLAEFKKAMDKLPTVWNTLTGLKP